MRTITIRLNDEEEKMLELCTDYLNSLPSSKGHRAMNVSDTIRYLIWDLYQEYFEQEVETKSLNPSDLT